MFIAVSGKGGVGKSSVAAMIVRELVSRRMRPVLAVDADPNNNLGDKLGVTVERTIGDLRESAQQQKYTTPAGTPKQRGVEYEVQQALVEGNDFDLVAMGRGEGPGCYCSINNMLRTFLQELSSGYQHVVIDNEAGMEHLSRRTNSKVGLMLVVSDPTPTGLQAAKRIAELAQRLEIIQGCNGLLLNRVNGVEIPNELVVDTGLELLGCVPDDPLVRSYELQRRPLLELPSESVAVKAISELLTRHGV